MGMTMEKAYEELELQDDFMFSMVMRDPKYCKPFLETVLGIKKKYGKNAIVKGMNLEEGAMTMERNRQIGGHRA